MEFALFALAGGFVTVMIIVALQIDHREWMYRRRERERNHGTFKDSA